MANRDVLKRDNEVVVLRRCQQKPKLRKTFSSYTDSDKFFPSPCAPPSKAKCHHPDLGVEVPKYDINMKVPILVEGSCVKLKSLLANKKVNRTFLLTNSGTRLGLNHLKTKYVLICCFFVPILKNSDAANICLAMGSLYSQLHARQGIKNFEMVMVAKMRSSWDNETVFDHFFSGFHDNCLSIPYWDTDSRDCVAKSLGLSSSSIDVAALVVAPSGEVLQVGYPEFLLDYGAASFPFSSLHFNNLCKEHSILQHRLSGISYGNKTSTSPVSLKELLECDTLSKLYDSRVCVSVSELDEKLVALYLFYDGRFLNKLGQLQQQCIDRGFEFEIVVVCLTFEDDPHCFLNHIKAEAEKVQLSVFWWVFPFDDKVCRTLCRICHGVCDDELFVLPSIRGHECGESEGRAISSLFGVDSYPFTKETIIANRESILKSYTLESLLEDYEYVVYKNKGSAETRVPVSDLQGKFVILYLDVVDFFDDDGFLYERLLKYYPEIRARHPGTEVVFVPLDPGTKRLMDKRLLHMPWPKLSSKISPASLIDKVMLMGVDPEASDYSTLITFGKDGHILSRYGHHRLYDGGIDSLFKDYLRSELITDLQETLDHFVA